MSLDKLTAMVGTGFAGLAPLLTNDLTTPVLTVPLTTVAGAICGTYAAIAYDDAPHPGTKLLALGVATTFLASMLVGVLPRALGWTWAGPVEAGLAGLLAVAIYALLPVAIVRGRELVRAFSLSDLLPGRKAAAKAPAAPAAPPQGNPEP